MNRIGFVFTLGALAAVSATAIDICIPAQPEIARDFGASPEAGAALVTWYLLGYGPGQLFWGPLSDRFGRLGPLYASVLGFLAASFACALAGSLELLVGMRFLQGLMGAGAPVVARAIARDQGGGPETAALISTMTVIVGGAPLVAPALGSGLLTLADWRWIFGFLVLFALLLLTSIFLFLQGRKRRTSRHAMSVAAYARSALPLFRAPEFLLGIGISSAIFGGYASFLAIGAAVAHTRYGVTSGEFGPIFSIAAIAFIFGSMTARQALRRFHRRWLLLAGALVALAVGSGLAAVSQAEPPMAALWLLLCLYIFSFGLLVPTATAMALEPAGANAGLASSIIGTAQILVGAFSSDLAASGLLGESYVSLCMIMATAAAAAFGFTLLSLRKIGRAS
ncbi:MAG: Bcr/CflA family efflux MFS transporter [Alphaproteobacteria bacterium]|nr:Bcr/CflA family efflux MFS transporter [Alphaproteobacteria bacterium]